MSGTITVDAPSFEDLIEQIQYPSEPFYIISEIGITNFLIKHKGVKYKVLIGDCNQCTCSQTRRNINCIHILFVLMRVYKLPSTSELLKRTGFNEYELNNILKGQAQKEMKKREELKRVASPRKKNSPRKIEEGDCCPICMEDISPGEIDLSLVYCRVSCGNYIHSACLKEYFASNYQKQKICPLCRADWKCDLENQLQEQKQLRFKKQEESVRFTCSECSSVLKRSQYTYSCQFCFKCRGTVIALCKNCFLNKDVHVQHKGKFFTYIIGSAKKIDHHLLKEDNTVVRQTQIFPHEIVLGSNSQFQTHSKTSQPSSLMKKQSRSVKVSSPKNDADLAIVGLNSKTDQSSTPPSHHSSASPTSIRSQSQTLFFRRPLTTSRRSPRTVNADELNSLLTIQPSLTVTTTNGSRKE